MSKCENKNCKTVPSFGYKGGKPKFCNQHKKFDMITIEV